MDIVLIAPALLVMAALLACVAFAGGKRPHAAVTPWSSIALFTGEPPADASAGAEAGVPTAPASDTLLADTLSELLALRGEVAELRSRVDLLSKRLDGRKTSERQARPSPQRQAA